MIGRRRHVAPTAWLGALACLAAACGGGGDSEVQMGLKRITLELAFEAEDVDPKERVEALPPVVQTDFALTPRNELVILPAPSTSLLPVLPDCPDAAAGAVPAQPASVGIDRPPLVGTYSTRNEGTLTVQAAASRFEGPYPARGRVEIAEVTDVTAPADDLVEPGARTIEFDHVLPIGNTTTTTRYRVTSTELLLVRREIVTPDATFSFLPTPPVTMMTLDTGEGDTWSSGGTDLETGATMVVQGVILSREAVDICGTMYDTYRVQSSERLILLSGESAFTQVTDDTSVEGGQPNIYNVATHLGGLFVRTETHMTTTTASLVVQEDNVATFDAVEPIPVTEQ